MARNAQGWRLVWRRGIARVRFTHQGRRHEITTGCRDSVEAAHVAARIYADVVSGAVRRTVTGALTHPATGLDGLVADWLAAVEPELGEGMVGTYTVYGRHWLRSMQTVADVTSAGVGAFQRERLTRVQRTTVVKERSALRRFLLWLVEQGHIGDVPDFPDLPRKATGTRHAQGRAKPSSVLTPAEVEAVLDELPDKSWDYFVALWETALRPVSTVARLVPADLTRFGLHIRAEADKNRWERTVPITARARMALERGLPFGARDLRAGFSAAVRRALGADRSATPYDLKHARITQWVDEGRPLGGIAYLTGVSIDTLTARYAHATRRAGEAVLWGHSGAEGAEASCEGEDLNLHGSYPTSTSSKSNPQKPRGYEPGTSDETAAIRGPSTDSGARPRTPAERALAASGEATARYEAELLVMDLDAAGGGR